MLFSREEIKILKEMFLKEENFIYSKAEYEKFDKMLDLESRVITLVRENSYDRSVKATPKK